MTKLIPMHNLKTNFDKVYLIVKSSLSSQLTESDNLQFYPQPPKMSDCAIISLAIVSESLGIDSENYLFSKLKEDYSAAFPMLVHRSNFNRRRRRLQQWIEAVNRGLAGQLSEGEDVFLVDSIPVPVCKLAREKRCKFRGNDFEESPDKGYSAVGKSYYYGYKLHVVTSLHGVYHSMELTKASVHDLHYLKQVAAEGLCEATLIGDKGYVSQGLQLELFAQHRIRLETPRKDNQQGRSRWPRIVSWARKRIETLFSQLCDQMMLKRNYAKTLAGLTARLTSKMAAVTVLQFMNRQNQKPLNHLKHALAA